MKNKICKHFFDVLNVVAMAGDGETVFWVICRWCGEVRKFNVKTKRA